MNILSCDWGTSRFRIHLMDQQKLSSICSLSTEQGVANLNLAWQAQSKLSRMDFFRAYLKEQIEQLVSLHQVDVKGVPLFISGMASSSIGMLELPYATLPFSIYGANIVQHSIGRTDAFPHDIYLLSGLGSQTDVMRGEETQVIGLQNTIRDKSVLLILPGTHSKHVDIQHGVVTDFSTFMTGEFFSLSANSSILSHSVAAASIDKKELMEAFAKGVQTLAREGYLRALFKVRTRTLLDQESDQNNYAFLSGIHLAAELQHLSNLEADTEIIICAQAQIALLYRFSLQTLKIPNKTYVIPGALADLATAYGHLALANRILSQ